MNEFLDENGQTGHGPDRKTEPAKLAEDAKWIFAKNPLVQVILWADQFGGAFATLTVIAAAKSRSPERNNIVSEIGIYQLGLQGS